MLGVAPSGIHHIATTPVVQASRTEPRSGFWTSQHRTFVPTTTPKRPLRHVYGDNLIYPRYPKYHDTSRTCTLAASDLQSSCHRSGHVLSASLPAWTRSRPRDFERGNSTSSPPSSAPVEIHSKNDSLDTNIKARRYSCPDCHCLTRHQLTDPLLGLMLCASVDEEQVRSSPPAIPSDPRLTQYSLTDYSPRLPSLKSRVRSARSSANSRATPRPRRRWTAEASTRCTTSSTRTSSS